jgi:hypothetical protein
MSSDSTFVVNSSNSAWFVNSVTSTALPQAGNRFTLIELNGMTPTGVVGVSGGFSLISLIEIFPVPVSARLVFATREGWIVAWTTDGVQILRIVEDFSAGGHVLTG